MRIAVASSGLGHVARGIETWAQDTAEALVGEAVDVTLFAAGELKGSGRRAGSPASTNEPILSTVVLSSLRRGDPRAARLAARSPGFTWRWGLKSDYGWEQLSFWWRLWPHLRRGRFDILHVQDPMLAYWCKLFRKTGLVRTKVILAHGTEETPRFLKQFAFVQHLAPWHLEQARTKIKEATDEHRWTQMGKRWVAIPNFVDTRMFAPCEGANLRAELGIPQDAFVVGTVAAVKKHHKRLDYLIREFSSFSSICVHPCSSVASFLIIAGAKTNDSDELVRLAEELAPGRIKFLFDRRREEMPGIYRTMDVFVLASLFEMMPIALLEALASGLPVVVNRHPILEWMAGTSGGADFRGGEAIDMSQPDELSGFLNAITPEWIGVSGAGARRQAEQNFAKSAVIRQYIEYYRRVWKWES